MRPTGYFAAKFPNPSSRQVFEPGSRVSKVLISRLIALEAWIPVSTGMTEIVAHKPFEAVAAVWATAPNLGN